MAQAIDGIRRVSVLLIAMVATPGVSLLVHAQAETAGAAVEVRRVEFNTVRPPNGGDPWMEAVVELNVSSAPEGGAYARFADRVRVAISLSIRKRTEGYEFFRASAEAVSLEAGRAAIRFYLPPEILQREQVSTDPFAYLVEISTRGRALADGSGTVASSVLNSPEITRNFKDRVAQAGPMNDGILVPQYESPFAASYPGDTPSYVRRPR